LTGAAITVLALAEPFIAAGAAVAFWSFFATEKGLSPRGYERIEIIHAWWVPPSTRIFVFTYTKESPQNSSILNYLNTFALLID
jgi:hypothetical protein